MKGHWSRTCHTPKYFADLYQASHKEKEKTLETNFVDINNPLSFTDLDVADFFENPEDK